MGTKINDMKPFVFTCYNCGHTWESDEFTEKICPECEGTEIDFEEVHAD